MPTVADDRRWLLLVFTAAWTMGGVIFYLLSPRTAPLLLPLSIVAPGLWQWATTGSIAWHRPSAVFLVLGLAGLYLLINGSWSLDPSTAYAEIACLFAFGASLAATVASLHESQRPVLRAMAIGFCGGVMLGGAFLCFETFSQQAVHRLLMYYVPSWGPAPRHMRMESGSVVFEPYLLNRSMTALALLLWPAALVLDRLEVTRPRHALALLGLVPAAAAIFRSEHATSKIALLGAAACWAAFCVSPRLVRRLTVVGWVGVTLLVAPLATLAYTEELYLASWLPGSARQRIVIWGYTSAQIAKAPLLGAGVSTARALNDHNVDAPRAPGTKYRLTTGWHSHNAYLQAWYETGAIGALFLLGLGLMVLRPLASAPAEIQPYLYATFISSALIAGSSYSLWAPWFMASLGFAALFAVLGSELAIPRAGAAGHPPRTGTTGM